MKIKSIHDPVFIKQVLVIIKLVELLPLENFSVWGSCGFGLKPPVIHYFIKEGFNLIAIAIIFLDQSKKKLFKMFHIFISELPCRNRRAVID